MNFDKLNFWIITLILLKLSVELSLEWLNRRNLVKTRQHGEPIPPDFNDFISKEDFHKSNNYTLAKSHLGTVELIIDTALLFMVLFSGIIPWFYGKSTQAFDFLPGIWRDSVFIFSFFIFIRIFSFPLEWYRIFYLESSFGFNTMNPRLWLVDFIKQTLISAIFTIPLLAGVFYLVEAAGDYWWVWGWIGFTLFQLIMFIVYPKWIMPWFNKFSPLTDGELREAILSLSQRLGFHSKEIMVMDGSKRSKHSNAFFIGIGKGRRVVFFDTLLEQLNVKEMQAVFAHEVGHFKKKHIVKRLAMMIFQMLLFFFLADLFKNLSGFNEYFGLSSGNLSHTLILLSYLAGIITFWITPISNLISRRHEFEADNFARAAMEGGESLISGLKKLHKENLGNLIPHPWYSFFYYSHPVLSERIKALQESDGA